MEIYLRAIAAIIAVPIFYKAYQFLHWVYRTWFIIGRAVDKVPGPPVKWPYGNLHLVGTSGFVGPPGFSKLCEIHETCHSVNLKSKFQGKTLFPDISK